MFPIEKKEAGMLRRRFIQLSLSISEKRLGIKKKTRTVFKKNILKAYYGTVLRILYAFLLRLYHPPGREVELFSY